MAAAALFFCDPLNSYTTGQLRWMAGGWPGMGGASEFVALTAGPMEVGLAPEIGGSVAWCRWRGIDLMRPLSDADAASGNVLGVACFPMVPYANRIAGNAFAFEGKAWRFEANNPPERLNVHGMGGGGRGGSRRARLTGCGSGCRWRHRPMPLARCRNLQLRLMRWWCGSR